MDLLSIITLIGGLTLIFFGMVIHINKSNGKSLMVFGVSIVTVVAFLLLLAEIGWFVFALLLLISISFTN